MKRREFVTLLGGGAGKISRLICALPTPALAALDWTGGTLMGGVLSHVLI
jgi:hypothetical protein